MKIMSGKTGAPHVTSQQFRQLVEGTVGQGSYILNSGENLEAELSSNNLLKIRSGIMSHHGNLSIVDIGTYDEVTIQNGTQGMKRIDLIVNRYTKNDETGIEENEWIVLMGTPDAESPVAPAYTEGNLQNGDLVDDCPVFEVHLDGINVTEVVSLLSVSPDIPTLNAALSDLYFEQGDEINLNQMVANGYITNNKSRIFVTIPVGKRLDHITSAKTSNATGMLRQNGNYLVGEAEESHGFAQVRGSFNILKDLGIIRYQYDFSGSISAAVNNDTVSLQFTGGVIQLS